MNFRELEKNAIQTRLRVLEHIKRAGKGHIGGTFSCVEILVALFRGQILKDFIPAKFGGSEHDFFLMGKGHASLALFSLYEELGWLDSSLFETFGQSGSTLGGQLDYRLPGNFYNSGSLGHVVGIAAGIAYRQKLKNSPYGAFCLVGDAECDEGSIWESFIMVSRLNLNNVCVIIDRNKLSVTQVIGDDDPLFKNFGQTVSSMGWDFHECNGHKFEELLPILKKVGTGNKPTLIMAHTIKGKGVDIFENGIKWHHSFPSPQEFDTAISQLKGQHDKLI